MTHRKQIQVSMSPSESERMTKLVDMWRNGHGEMPSRSVTRSAVVNWLVYQEYQRIACKLAERASGGR